MTVEFGVLGGVWAARDGEPVDLGGFRQRSVVARLLTASGAVVPADLLVADLWHAETPPRAQAALQAHISHLRRALEPDRAPRTPARLLVTVPPGYALRPDDDAVDAARAARLLAAGDRLLDADPSAARDSYAAALELWRGPAYAEYADEPWAAPEAARLDELRLTAVERWAAAALAAGGGPDPLPRLRAHVAEHPLREEGWRLLALGLYRAGRQADALAALREVRQRLADELGVDPGPALRRLEDDVLAQSPGLLRAPRETAPPRALQAPRTQSTSPPTAPALVGRDDELAALRGAADRAAAGRLAVAVVTGEAGGGKSALVERLAADLAAEGWTTVLARCPETDGAPGGWPWTEALGRLAREHPPASPERLAPLLQDAPAADTGDAVASRFRLHRAVVEWLGGIGGPLLVVLDDLHRADSETASLLLDLVDGLAGAPVLVVAATRPEPLPELDAVLAALARRDPVRLTLTGLAPAAVGRLVDEVSPTPVDDAVRTAIAERTGGNPFLVRELARLVSTGADVAAVPGGVRDVVRSRLAALPAQTGSLLRLAAVSGRDVDVDVLLEAAGADEDDDAVVDALESALVSGLLVEPGPGRLRFVHALVRDTLYEDLSSLRRTRLHGRLAAALERLRPADVTALAHHSEAAGPAHAAATARWAAAAAELAERRFAYRDAQSWWRRAAAASAVAAPGDEAGRLRLVARAARSATLAGDMPTGRELRDQALPVALAVGDPVLTAEVLLSCDVPTLWVPRHTTIDDVVSAAAEEVLPALADRPDLRCRLLGVIAVALAGDPDPRGYEASLEAVELARGTGDPQLLAAALNARYLNTYRHGGLDERGRLGQELLELAQREQLGLFEATARLVLLQHSCGVLDLEAADRHAAEAERLALAYGLPLLRGIAAWYAGLRAGIAGRYDDAEAAYGAAAALVSETGFWSEQAYGLWWISMLCLRIGAGRHAGLAESTRGMYDVSPEDAHEVLLAALVLEGQVDEARELAGTRYPVGQDFFTPVWLFMRGLVGLGLDDAERIEDAYAGLLPHEHAVCGAWTATVALGPTATLLARLAAARGDTAAAVRHQRVAVEVAERTGNTDWITAAHRALSR